MTSKELSGNKIAEDLRQFLVDNKHASVHTYKKKMVSLIKELENVTVTGETTQNGGCSCNKEVKKLEEAITLNTDDSSDWEEYNLDKELSKLTVSTNDKNVSKQECTEKSPAATSKSMPVKPDNNYFDQRVFDKENFTDEVFIKQIVNLMVNVLFAASESKIDYIQQEAINALRHITKIEVLKKKFFVAELTNLLKNGSLNDRKSVWTSFFNIIEDNVEYRDILFKSGIVYNLKVFIESQENTIGTLRMVAWFLWNLSRYKKPISRKSEKKFAMVLVQLLHKQDSKILITALKALQERCKVYPVFRPINQSEQNSETLRHIETLLDHPDMKVQIEALQVIHEATTQILHKTQFFINAIQHMEKYVKHEDHKINMVAVKFLAYMVQDTNFQIEAIFDAKFISFVFDLMNKDYALLQLESIKVIHNIIKNEATKYSLYLVTSGVIEALCNLLKTTKNLSAYISGFMCLVEVYLKTELLTERASLDLQKYGSKSMISSIEMYKKVQKEKEDQQMKDKLIF